MGIWDWTINFKKTEFIAINTDQEFQINIEERCTIKQVQNFKYLGVSLNKNGRVTLRLL